MSGRSLFESRGLRYFYRFLKTFFCIFQRFHVFTFSVFFAFLSFHFVSKPEVT